MIGNGVNVIVLRGVAVGMTSCAIGAVGVWVALGVGVVDAVTVTVEDGLGRVRVGVRVALDVAVGFTVAVTVEGCSVNV